MLFTDKKALFETHTDALIKDVDAARKSLNDFHSELASLQYGPGAGISVAKLSAELNRIFTRAQCLGNTLYAIGLCVAAEDQS